jgi:hypothetical protein
MAGGLQPEKDENFALMMKKKDEKNQDLNNAKIKLHQLTCTNTSPYLQALIDKKKVNALQQVLSTFLPHPSLVLPPPHLYHLR